VGFKNKESLLFAIEKVVLSVFLWKKALEL